MADKVWEWAKSILVAVVIVAILNIFIGTTSVVSTSMNPTLVENDILLMLKRIDVKRGDIITFNSKLEISNSDIQNLDFFKTIFMKEGDKKILIKRVVGLPGDKVEIRNGSVYINDIIYNESMYLTQRTKGNIIINKIPKGKYFVMGDNREVSLDSRSKKVGLVDKDDINGVVILRTYPLFKIKIFRGL